MSDDREESRGWPGEGWALVAALSFTQVVSWGVLYYAFGVLVAPMQAELGWSQGLLGGGFSVALLVSALLAVPIGRWLARRGPRALMSIGSCAGALLVLAWSWVASPLAFFALCVALGFPLASTLYEAALAATVQRFGSGERSDRALLVLTVVAGLASTVFVPLTQALVAQYGWRVALRVLGVGLGVTTIPLHALVLLSGTPRARRVPPSVRVETLAASGERRAAERAAWAAAAIGAGQVLGRIAFTFLRPRGSLAPWSFTLFLSGALGLALLAAEPAPALVWLAVVLFGLASGAQTLARTAWALELREPADFPRVNGVLGLWSLAGRAGAPLALGLAHDASGSHGPGLWALAGLSVVGGVCARLALAGGKNVRAIDSRAGGR